MDRRETRSSRRANIISYVHCTYAICKADDLTVVRGTKAGLKAEAEAIKRALRAMENFMLQEY